MCYRVDREEGRRNLERFLEHWGNAEWDLPEVAEARKLLGRRLERNSDPPL